jgi:hypothetical protein
LRHLAGSALAEAGCSVPQIMSVLGHLTEKHAYHYVRQANRLRLADDAVAMWERDDQRLAYRAAPRGGDGRRTKYGRTGKTNWKKWC